MLDRHTLLTIYTPLGPSAQKLIMNGSSTLKYVHVYIGIHTYPHPTPKDT